MEHIGIDVHKKTSQVCICTEDGELVERKIATARDTHDFDGQVAAPVPRPGTRIDGELGLFTYSVGRRINPTHSVDEVRYERHSIPVAIRVLRHDAPYVVLDVQTRPGAEFPPTIRGLGGEIAVLFPGRVDAYTELSTWVVPPLRGHGD